MSNVYASVPLELGTSTIRVVEILDCSEGEAQSLIACKFHKISLDSSPYMTVSYTWGSPGTTQAIEIDGQAIEIRQNLWDFLHEARRREDARSQRIWIDAICINQADVIERNYQVAMMGQIYSKAQKVVVWLGSEDPIVPVQYWEDDTSEDVEVREDLGFTEETLKKTLFELCARPYWARLWILQECVLAKDIDIWSGTQKASIDEFLKLFHCYIGLEPDPKTRLATGQVESVLKCREAYQDPAGRAPLWILISEYDFMGCSDVRDRIFAVLSLLDEEERRGFGVEPDYSRTPYELFGDICTRYIGRGADTAMVADLCTLHELLGLDRERSALSQVLAVLP